MNTFASFRALARVGAGVALAAAGLLWISQVHGQPAPAPSIEIVDAWVRPTPPGADVAAAYATLRNASSSTLTLIGVSADAASSAELHEMQMRDGMMRMRQLKDGLPLAAGQTVALESGGTHLMLFGLRKPLRAGEHIQLLFTVSDGREISIRVPVREPHS